MVDLEKLESRVVKALVSIIAQAVEDPLCPVYEIFSGRQYDIPIPKSTIVQAAKATAAVLLSYQSGYQEPKPEDTGWGEG